MKRIVLAAALAMAVSGCATLFQGSTQAISISSAPEGATVTITNRAGERVHVGETPVKLELKSFAKPGFAPEQLTIRGSTNGWYFGNLLIGGLIGMVAVDPATGAMYSLPKTVSATLQPAAALGSDEPPQLQIISTASLSAEQMREAVRLNVAD
jgi:hypothetical protein